MSVPGEIEGTQFDQCGLPRPHESDVAMGNVCFGLEDGVQGNQTHQRHARRNHSAGGVHRKFLNRAVDWRHQTGES